MSCIQFREINFRPETRERIDEMVKIVGEYQRQGLKLTARQLYYQFVSRNIVPNTERSYKSVTSLLADARYAGLVDWDAIEDRGREATVWRDYEDLQQLVDSMSQSYRLPRWRTQPIYVELWVEKQALAGVLEPLAGEYHVPLMVNKGYSSASAMFDAAQRIMRMSNQAESDYYDSDRSEQDRAIFYLGDHDPSGEDMVRDIRERLVEFGCVDLKVRKIALTMAQIRQYNPPPNPAKMSDSRAPAYVAKYGNYSWEVDALPPDVLQQLIRSAFDEVVDKDAMNEIKAKERADKDRLKRAVTLGEDD